MLHVKLDRLSTCDNTNRTMLVFVKPEPNKVNSNLTSALEFLMLLVTWLPI